MTLRGLRREWVDFWRRLAVHAKRMELRRRLSRMISAHHTVSTGEIGDLLTALGWTTVSCSLHHEEFTKRFGPGMTRTVNVITQSSPERIRALLEWIERAEFFL